ncbi:hypothetical protein CEP54_015657 [Fusarium duplospermum]|uniref:Uncharacterized protein n=1 Tax=Fusarium duplospermum TaxID=1325734 RepID=A0A428NMD7_9HYPO|nr:hypothetical protein CEP54_015657 [Fusarium duplospermum]
MESDKKIKRATPESHPSSQLDPALYQQKQSMLFRLPQELRLKIYEHLFSSKRLQWHFRKTSHPMRPESTPRQTLALVRTCHRVKDEIGDSWVGQIHLTFRTPEIMLDVLTELPVSTLSKIRHVRVTAEPVLTQPPPVRPQTRFYFISALLKLLPGLRLDTLTIQGTSPILTFWGSKILDELISRSCGWKELYYITREVTLLGFRHRPVRDHPQPENWQRIMDDRDGTETKPSITIYRSTHPIMDDNTSLAFERDMPDDWTAGVTLGTNLNENLFKTIGDRRGIMVVVKGGLGVDYEEKEGSPLLEKDIRSDAPGMTWQEIQYVYDPYSALYINDEFCYVQYR